MSNQQSRPLQTLRFICAVMIFLHHLPFYDYPNLVAIDARFYYYFFSPLTFFFILSGWALTHTYYEKILKKNFNVWTYVKKRILRLYPAHFATILLSIPLLIAVRKVVPIAETLTNVFLIHAFIPSSDYLFSYNPISWSLSIFLFLYLLFPFFQLLIPRFDRFIRKSALPLVIIFVIGLGLYLAFTDYHDSLTYAYYFSPFERLVDFVVGILTYFIVKENLSKVKPVLLSLLEFFALAIIFAAHWYAYRIPPPYVWDLYFIFPWAIVIGVFSLSRGVFSKILSWKPFVMLGSISLEFFLLNNLSIQWVYLYIAHSIQMNSIEKGLLTFLVTLTGSIILHIALIYLIPRPKLRPTSAIA
jgi:peptidoglycan/LPS O-acetylase OafA/YrhL